MWQTMLLKQHTNITPGIFWEEVMFISSVLFDIGFVLIIRQVNIAMCAQYKEMSVLFSSFQQMYC